jgi:DNA (cytosine-5)-methyltransferase 1
MRYGSVCSGIEAATAAWHHMGWEPAFFSEIEKFPRAVLEHRYPDVPLHGDFTTIEDNQYGKIDLLVGGTPCQSFSVAGLRGGLDDDRGNLALEFCRLAQRERPRWIVWENVPGVLSSSGGRDFGSILGALAEIGYGLAYRVLDAQYFGVAQRRRRVFVVGYLGDWRCAAAVLFERHSLCGHPAPSREARQDAAGGTAPRASERGGRGGDGSAVGTLRTRRPGEGGVQGDFDHIVPVVSPALNTQSGSHHAPDTKAYVALATFNDDGTARTLTARHDSSPCVDRGPDVVAFTQNTRDEVRYINGNGQITGALAASSGMKQTNYIAFSSKDYGADAMNDCSPTLRAGGHNGSHADAGVPPAVAFKIGAGAQAGSIGFEEEVSPTLTATDSGTQRSPGLLQHSAVRRLTPVECERLQGFPDNFTAIPWGKKAAEDCPDGPRHKALGNSMAVPVMRWIGERIQMVDDLVSVL